MNLLRLLAGRDLPEPAAPHYRCPTCLTRSDDLGSQAEADLLLETHRAYFCRPVGRFDVVALPAHERGVR